MLASTSANGAPRNQDSLNHLPYHCAHCRADHSEVARIASPRVQKSAMKTQMRTNQQDIAQLFIGANDGVKQKHSEYEQDEAHQEDVGAGFVRLGIEQNDEVVPRR